jgi:hypothetical protein
MHRVMVAPGPARLPLTVVTSATPSRLPALEAQCNSWEGPLVAAVYVGLRVERPEQAGAGMQPGALLLAEHAAKLDWVTDQLLALQRRRGLLGTDGWVGAGRYAATTWPVRWPPCPPGPSGSIATPNCRFLLPSLAARLKSSACQLTLLLVYELLGDEVIGECGLRHGCPHFFKQVLGCDQIRHHNPGYARCPSQAWFV